MSSKDNLTEQSLFNITKAIRDAYQKEKPIPIDFFIHVDFLEKSSKTIYIPFKTGRQPYEINETLISNMIEHLPVQAYQNYFQFRWIYGGSDHDSSIIKKALWHKKYPFIQSFLQFGEQFLNDNETEEGFYGSRKDDYLKYVLMPILDLGNNIHSFDTNTTYNIKRTTQSYEKFVEIQTQDAQQYLNNFKTALSQFKIISEQQAKLYGIKKTNINIQQWIKIYPFVDSYRRDDNEDFIKKIVKHEFLYPIFEEINSQKSLIKKEYFNIAFLNANHKVIDFMQPVLSLSEEELLTLFKKMISKLSKEEIDLFSKESDYNKSIGDNHLILQAGIELAKKYIHDFTGLNIVDYLGILLTNDTNTIEQIKDIFNLNKNTLLVEEFTINDLFHAAKLFDEFIITHKLFINKHPRRPIEEVPHNKFILYLGGILKQNFPEFITEQITHEQKIKINSFIAAEFLPEVDLKASNISQQDLLVHFRTFILEQNLLQKPEKNKLKI